MNGKDINTALGTKEFDPNERVLILIFEFFKMSLRDIAQQLLLEKNYFSKDQLENVSNAMISVLAYLQNQDIPYPQLTN